jgi:TM2 domain-containing membrane protein YozV
VLGLIKNFNPDMNTGVITIGKEEFKFDIKDWIPDVPPEEGDEVAFELRGVSPYNINLRGALMNKDNAVKIRYLAVFLSFFFGWMGAQRFYLGYYRIGVIQCIVSGVLLAAGMMGYALLWGFVEALLIFGGHIDRDAQGRPLR